LLAERFNDPAYWRPGRQARWIRVAALLPVAGAIVYACVLWGL
jgi:hypothetical protein